MDLATQANIAELASNKPKDDNFVVILGSPDAESTELTALTVLSGDPTFAGALAGVQLGLPVYHVLEDVVRESFDADAYDEHISLMADVLAADEIRATMERVRAENAG
jgi:glycine reductase